MNLLIKIVIDDSIEIVKEIVNIIDIIVTYRDIVGVVSNLNIFLFAK
jgi:hypothetical protein